jgi:hypothetical protein
MSAFLSWVDASGRPRVMYFDLTITQSISTTQQITDYAVERGSNIVDHSRELPASVTLEVMVSNAPVYDLPDHSRLEVRAKQTLKVATNGGSIIVDDFSADQFRQGNYVRESYELLSQLRREATLLEVSTDYQAFDSMIIQAIDIQDGEENGDAGMFAIRLREIRIAESQDVNAPSIPVAKKPVSKGKQDLKDDGTNGQQKSVAEGLVDMLPDSVKSRLPFGIGK